MERKMLNQSERLMTTALTIFSIDMSVSAHDLLVTCFAEMIDCELNHA